jgi:hypothetical protein
MKAYVMALKAYTLVGCETGIFCSGGGREDHYANLGDFSLIQATFFSEKVMF